MRVTPAETARQRIKRAGRRRGGRMYAQSQGEISRAALDGAGETVSLAQQRLSGGFPATSDWRRVAAQSEAAA